MSGGVGPCGDVHAEEPDDFGPVGSSGGLGAHLGYGVGGRTCGPLGPDCDSGWRGPCGVAGEAHGGKRGGGPICGYGSGALSNGGLVDDGCRSRARMCYLCRAGWGWRHRYRSGPC
jgi:hypothetical protein